MKSTKIYNLTILTSYYSKNGIKYRNRRVKVEADKNISFNELEQLADKEWGKNPFNDSFVEMLWEN